MSLCSASRILERARAGERLLADGGISTELMRRGVAMEDILRANLEQPETVYAVHAAYLEAGVDILTSNTFGLREGVDWANRFRAGVGLAIQAARGSANEVGVWISLLPSLVPLEKEGLAYLAEHLMHWPNALLIETCASLREAVAAAEAARSLNPALLAVTCHFRADATMPDGTTPEAAAQTLAEAGAHIVGANCGETPESFVEITRRMRAVTDLPILVQPSAGLPKQNEAGDWVYPVGPQEFAEVAGRLWEAGATLVGGCCGTTPETIAAVKGVQVFRYSGIQETF